jgi:hypothetical protein
LNYKYSKGYPSSKNNIIPKTKQRTKLISPNASQQNLKFSIVKGDSKYIKNKKREFSRNSSRTKLNKGKANFDNSINRSRSPRYLDWGMESHVGNRINYDYSKPYKSPDLIKYEKSPRKRSENYNPLQTKAKTFKRKSPIKINTTQPVSLANSKHFDKGNTDSLLMKLKENKMDNIDFYNLDLGNKKMKDVATKMPQNQRNYNNMSDQKMRKKQESNLEYQQ